MQRSSHRIKQDHKRQAQHSKKVQAIATNRKQQSQSIAQRRIKLGKIAI